MSKGPKDIRIGVNTLFLIPGQVGGSETYLRETLGALQREPGVTLHLFTNSENHAGFADGLGAHPNVALTAMHCQAKRRPERILREQFQLPRAAEGAPIDVLWNPGYTAPRRCRRPMVTSILDMQYKHFPQDLSLPARLATDVLVQSAARRSRRIITISDYARQDILRYTAAQPERIHVTHLAADTAFAHAAPDALLPAAVATPYLLCVANSYPHKNLAALVKAFAELASEVPHQLVLAGHPRRGETELQRALAALPTDVQQRVVRLGHLDRPSLIALYQQAELFLFPSLYEGFGLPVLEAMLAGTRVVTTGCASIPEVSGNHAIVAQAPQAIPLAHAIRAGLGESAQVRRAAVEAANQWAGTFTWQRTARQTLDILQMAIGD